MDWAVRRTRAEDTKGAVWNATHQIIKGNIKTTIGPSEFCSSVIVDEG